MSKSKISETKKLTHKLAIEGTLSVNDNHTISINVEGEDTKTLHELVRNFSESYVKITVTEEDIEDVEQE